MQNFNYFKVHPIIVVNMVSDYIKDAILNDGDTLREIEEDLKKDLQ